MVDIRIINEENKLKLLGQIEKLQKKIKRNEHLELSSDSCSNNGGEESTTDKFIESINQLNNKIKQLQNPEPIYV